jgi:sigma-B regulation protein RsbU (phosphoserine phosphatase)
MEKGDQLVVFTDGLNEARNRKGQEFGIENVKKTITQNRLLNSQALTETLKDRLLKFSSSLARHDDITLIAVTVKK